MLSQRCQRGFESPAKIRLCCLMAHHRRFAVGAAALVDSVAVAALFNGIDRIADATGAPLEQTKADATVELRSEIGINAFGDQKEALEAAEGKSAAE